MKSVLPCIALTLCLLMPQSGNAQQKLLLGGGKSVAMDSLPQSRLKADIGKLSPSARVSALRRIGALGIPTVDADTLRASKDGALYYEDPAFGGDVPTFDPGQLKDKAAIPSIDESTVSIDPALAFSLHSRPGASTTVYLDFRGETVTGTMWNTISGIASNTLLPYSEDDDTATFTQDERNTIAEVWKRVSEDYAPFDIDVTTEDPGAFGPTVAHIVIAPRRDAAGSYIYNCSCGGVAFLGVWGRSDYATSYQPALVFPEGVPGAKNITEAASHEFGHNLGLSHDGTASVGYYSGHGTGNVSWGPLMGVGYYTNVSQWSKGEYSGANNYEDDLAIISAELGYADDDHGDSAANATTLGCVDKRGSQISLDLIQGLLLRGGSLGLSERCERRCVGDY